jgi:hypothetical protein
MLTRVLAAGALIVWLPSVTFAQAAAGAPETTPRPASPKKFEIVDNSFFVEEAFNQDRGIFQNIFSWARDRSGQWNGSFTQEWPAPAITHQLSYTIPFDGGESSASFGGVLLNYRYQVLEEAAGRPAVAPRFSVILPTGRAIDDSDRPGVQVNLPVSKQVGDLYVHGNAGFTWLHGVSAGDTAKPNLMSPTFAGSVVWNTRPSINLMLEGVWTLQDSVIGLQQTRRDRVATISPGVRGGWTLPGDQQIILGAAVPVTLTEGEERSAAFLMYFSYELPFTSNR